MTDIHSTALVADTVKLWRDVSIGPYCCVDGNVVLGDKCRLMRMWCHRKYHYRAQARIFPLPPSGIFRRI